MIGYPANDRRYYPFYAKCVELGVPLSIHTSANWASLPLANGVGRRVIRCVALTPLLLFALAANTAHADSWFHKKGRHAKEGWISTPGDGAERCRG
jgi:predicted TIM-barrel fold metal-dependent hydrolase